MTRPHRNHSGFTLVELLVVIAILAVLATLGMTVGTRMLAKGKHATMINNMRQMGPLFTIYASDNHQQLLPCRAPRTQPDGSVENMIWHEVLLSIVYPDMDPAEFSTEDWWQANDDHFLRNPLFLARDQPVGWGPLNPGYGYNLMLPENYMMAEEGVVPGQEQLEQVSVPLALLDRPARTPIVAPCDNYYYRYDESEIGNFESGTLNKFLSEDKFPVLFLSGHVELMRPNDYVNRNLHEMPYDPAEDSNP